MGGGTVYFDGTVNFTQSDNCLANNLGFHVCTHTFVLFSGFPCPFGSYAYRIIATRKAEADRWIIGTGSVVFRGIIILSRPGGALHEPSRHEYRYSIDPPNFTEALEYIYSKTILLQVTEEYKMMREYILFKTSHQAVVSSSRA